VYKKISASISAGLEKYGIESFFLLLIFSFTWIGYGRRYVIGFTLLVFIFSLFFKSKRVFLFKDRALLILLVLFVVNNVISSLLSPNKLESTLLSLLWFLVIFVPMSYAGFSIKSNDFFVKWIVPVSMILALLNLLYQSGMFIYTSLDQGLIFKRYKFFFIGRTATIDVIVMLSGLGYGWFRQKDNRKNLWLGFFYLLFCNFGMILTNDRGGLIALFIVTVLLLSFDYKRLIIYVVMILAGFSLTFMGDSFKDLQHFYIYIKSLIANKPLRDVVGQVHAFRAAVEMIKDNWLLGVGTNNFLKFSKQYWRGRGFSYAHNIVLQFWAENGLFGMIFGLSIIGLVIYRWLKSWKLYRYKYVALGTGASFIGILVGNLSNSTIWILYIALPFWLLGGVLSAIYFSVYDEDFDLDNRAHEVEAQMNNG
jgi:O-antigen ligase